LGCRCGLQWPTENRRHNRSTFFDCHPIQSTKLSTCVWRVGRLSSLQNDDSVFRMIFSGRAPGRCMRRTVKLMRERLTGLSLSIPSIFAATDALRSNLPQRAQSMRVASISAVPEQGETADHALRNLFHGHLGPPQSAKEQIAKRDVPCVYHGPSGTKRERLISKGFLDFKTGRDFKENGSRKLLKSLAIPAGFEPATHGVEIRYYPERFDR
jgi:hypothetical protein